MTRAILLLFIAVASVFGQQGFGVFPPTGGGTSSASLQAGQPYNLTTTSASGTTYTATASPTLLVLAAEAGTFNWNVGATLCTAGAVTLNIDSLGAKAVKEADGTTDPVAADCTANRRVQLRYDGTVFRIVGGGQVNSGSVTHSVGSLAADAYAVGNIGGDIKTPCSGCTLNSGGDGVWTGTGTFGNGSGNAGSSSWVQGTDQTIVANSVGWGAPVTVTAALRLLFANALPIANQFMLFPAPTASESQFVWTTFTSTNLTDTATISRIVAAGTSTMATGAISANTCASTVTTAATGAASTSKVIWTTNADVSSVTGYGFTATDGLKVYVWPTTNNVNFHVCNGTASSITPGSAVTFNWEVH